MNVKFSATKVGIAFFLCLAWTMSVTGCTPGMNSAKSEMAKLQGSWQLVYQKMNARKLPDENAAEMFNGKMVFAGEKIRYTVELPGFDFGFAYQLHPAHQPKEIDLELIQSRDRQDIGQKLLGIYLLEGDSLKICHSKTKRPADFDAGERSQNVLIVLKRKLSERGGEK